MLHSVLVSFVRVRDSGFCSALSSTTQQHLPQGVVSTDNEVY